ncbi:MAG: hypothetical protein K2J95_09190 [Lachnospiraceae bacterium]|nr:hypothetical protein [Lachnospiraceae bacterium]
MAEDKSKTVIVKARAKAFLTSQPEENDPLTAVTVHKRTVSKLQKSTPSAAEIAAAIRKGEVSEAVKNTSVDSAADAKKSTVVVVMRQESVINRKNKLTEDGRVKKIPACKMAEPMKRPADDTLIISGRVVAASKKIQTPVMAVAPTIVKAAKPEPEKTVEKPTAKPAVKKAEPKKAAAKPTAKPVVKKAEPKKAAAKPTAKPAVKKAEPKKTAAKSAVKKAEPKKAAAKPTAKKTAIVQNTYIQYQNETYKEADLVALAEKLWTKDMKRKAADLKSLELYVKPQERMAYCVFNKKETGSFAI